MEILNYTEMSLPSFNDIEVKNIEKNIKKALDEAEKSLKKLEKSCTPTWPSVMDSINEIQIKIHKVWSPVSHLHSVRNTEELRKVYANLIEPMTTFSLRMEQSPEIYKALCALKESPEFKKLSSTKQRILNKKIQEAKLSGIDLAKEQKEIFNENAKKLSKLQTSFSNNVLDATKEFSLTVTNEKDLGKLPESYRELASDAYNRKFEKAQKKSNKEKGPWLITLDYTSYGPFMETSPSRTLRKELYLAFLKRASHGKFDNTQNIKEILKLRQEQAKILGFNSYAELSLATKMAETVSQIYKMTDELKGPSKKRAQIELDEIKAFAQKNSDIKELFHWDLSYWAKRLQENKFSYEEDELKPYFSFQTATKGLFDLAKNLFSIAVKEETSKDIQFWDEHIKFYNVYDKEEKHIASFYLDPYSRPHNKRGGAWMDVCINRKKETSGSITRPVAYLVCNFTPPTKEDPSLLTFREVETLFHEFGHGLQHMLTSIEDLEAAGINGVEWDAVELPSQFMENWCYHKKTLLGMAKHYKTGETLPEDLYRKLLESKNYMAALFTLRQIQFALIDLHLHDDFDASKQNDPFAVQKEIASEVLVMKPHEDDRFLCSFSHIFAGGYSAGYYSYKWAEILSADAFSRFEEVNMDNLEEIKEIGLKFRDTILGLGGSDDPMKIFETFRGRKPNTEALLRHRGLI